MSRNFELMRRAQQKSETADIGSLWEPNEAATTSSRGTKRQTQIQAAANDNGFHWQHALVILKRRWRTSLLFAGVVLATVIIGSLLLKPKYKPEARIEIDPPGAELFSLDGERSGVGDAEYLETQSKGLQGYELAIDVIRTLHLDQNRDLMEAPLITKITAPVLTPLKKLSKRLWAQKESDSSSENSNAPRLTPEESLALQRFQERLDVTRDTSSHLVTVSFEAHSPRLAATTTNTVINLFIDRSYKTRHDAIMQSSEWLGRQLDDVRKRLDDSNRALADFQKATGIADLDQDRNTFADQISELNHELTQAQADRIQLSAFLGKVREGGPDSLPQVRSSPVIQQLTERFAEARAELSQARVVYGKNHPNVKKLENQTNELETQLAVERAAILGSIKTSYSAAQAREVMLAGQMKNATLQSSQMAQYNSLKRDAQANANLYNGLLAKVKEAGIAAASKSSNIRVVDRARVLDQPTTPNWLLNIAVGIFAGLLGGLAIPFLLDMLEDKLHTPEDIKKWTGISAVSIVPAISSNGHSAAELMRGRGFGPLTIGKPKLSKPLKFLEGSSSPEAEAMQGLHTSIMLSQSGRPPRVLLMVSALPGEGKTTLSVNLAIALAKHGSTCLVDADLRGSKIAAVFGLSDEQGLADVLKGSAKLEQVLLGFPEVSNLTILPAGAGAQNPAQLMCSETARQCLLELRQRFDFVVIDTPPILRFADARALASLADGLLFVGRSGATTREAITRSLDLLSQHQAAPILEFVLNAADTHLPDCRYYQYGYS